MSGIQVDPNSTTRYAMDRFGGDYTKLVMQCADLSAYAEAATARVEELEKQGEADRQTIQTLERLLNETRPALEQLQVANQELRAKVEELQPEDIPT
jgi:uncharacterized coiled-coil protein SlyX